MSEKLRVNDLKIECEYCGFYQSYEIGHCLWCGEPKLMPHLSEVGKKLLIQNMIINEKFWLDLLGKLREPQQQDFLEQVSVMIDKLMQNLRKKNQCQT